MTPWKRKEVIGSCTLYLGDCMEILPTLGKVDAVVTDPPYADAYQAQWGKAKRKDGVQMDDALSFSGIDALMPALPSEVARVCAGWGVFFTNIEGVSMWMDALQKWKPDNVLAWVKPDCTPRLNGEGPARGFEPAITCWFGHGRRKWNSGGKRGVYTHMVNAGRHGGHPTEKPLPLMRELLEDFVPEFGSVLDPFMGSGTTGVACVKTGRSFIGIEQHEPYFDIACERIRKAYAQPDMFVSAPKAQEPLQEAML